MKFPNYIHCLILSAQFSIQIKGLNTQAIQKNVFVRDYDTNQLVI
jgi:hypothetical protein